MHVLQLTTNAEATYVTNQVAALDALGVESDVLEVPKTGSDGRRPLDYLAFPRTVRRACGEEYDLVHANYGLTILGGLAQRRVPLVTTLVGTDLMGPYGVVSKHLSRGCAAVIVVNEAMAEMVPSEASVIPYGIDVDRFRPMDRDDARERIGWPTSGYRVLYPYHPNRPEKNYDLAERVVDAAADRLDEPVELCVATGLEYSLMPYYMNAADAMILTSHREGSPSTVKEALACDTSVVSTPVGDVPERVAGVDGCAIGESVSTLAGGIETALTSRPDGRCRAAVSDLTVEWTGERIRSVYERVLDREGVGRPSARRTSSVEGAR